MYNTIYRCLRPGRTRLDAELVVDIAAALLGDALLAAPWRRACQVIEGLASDTVNVSVKYTMPDDLAGFAGRAEETSTLVAAIAGQPVGASVVVAIDGMAGVGKTAFAIHLAHHLMAAGRVPDLCLTVDLRGCDARHAPAEPAVVLDGFLRLLGVLGSRVAAMALDRRAAAVKDRLADRRVLLLLDNAASTEQVRPLLLDIPGSVTLVTSRRSLDGITATSHLALDMLRPAESFAMLQGEIGGDRAAVDSRAVSGIANVVGHLPLALSVVVEQIRHKPEWTVADHLERLSRRRADLRLDEEVSSAIALSYDSLDSEQRRLLRLVALHSGGAFDQYAAAALAGTELADTRSRLAELTANSLLRHRADDRYELSDPMRVFASDRARDEDPARARRAAVRRLLDHYVRQAVTATALYLSRNGTRPSTRDNTYPDLSDRAAAAAWLDRERANLIASAAYAAAHGWPDHVRQLSRALRGYLQQTRHLADAEILHLLATPTLNRSARARTSHNLGVIYGTLGRHWEARELLAQAVAIRAGLSVPALSPAGSPVLTGCPGLVPSAPTLPEIELV